MEMSIVEKIRELQFSKDGKVSLSVLEQSLGMGNGTISGWSKKSPQLSKLLLIADYFNVSIDYLIGRENSDRYETKLSIEEKILINNFQKSSRTDQQALLQISKTLATAASTAAADDETEDKRLTRRIRLDLEDQEQEEEQVF